MSDLDARLRVIEDKFEILDLLAKYRNLVDKFQYAEWADALFTDDAVIDTSGTIYGLQNGQADIKANALRNSTGSWVDTMHLMINPEIILEGDNAHGTVDMLYYGVPVGTHRTNFVFDGARFDMKYRRTSAGWRISRIDTHFCLGGLAERAGFLMALAERNKALRL